MDHSLRFTMRSATPVVVLAASAPAFAQKDCPTFGHDLAGTPYSTLKQIDTKNVTYHMDSGAPPAAVAAPEPGSSDAGDAVAGDPPGGTGRGGRGGRGGPGGGGGNSEVPPLVIDGVMYLTTGGRKVVALEPEFGKEIWAYSATDGALATRGLEFWACDRQSPATVFFGASGDKSHSDSLIAVELQ
jgi:quinoprotein glucose dehydrogenase